VADPSGLVSRTKWRSVGPEADSERTRRRRFTSTPTATTGTAPIIFLALLKFRMQHPFMIKHNTSQPQIARVSKIVAPAKQ
jgi:hypothetical protein